MTIASGVAACTVAVLLTGLTACAHSNLRLELDVYRGDPSREIPLTADQLGAIHGQLDLASHKLQGDLNEQKDLATGMLAVYKGFYCLKTTLRVTNAACDTTVFRALDQPYQDHLATLDRRARAVLELVDSARSSVGLYEALLPLKETFAAPAGTTSAIPVTAGTPHSRDAETRLALQAARMRMRVGSASDSVSAFAKAPHTQFPDVLAAHWDSIINSVDRTVAIADTSGIDSVKTRNLAEKVSALAATPGLPTELRDSLARGRVSAAALTSALKLIGRQGTVPVLRQTSTELAAGLASLVGSRDLYDSQIDRLKDPADPVWKLISSPENAWRWNQVFTRTWFYAQGNSDVIIVRDGPLDYRIQNASNNPAALIQSQLQISRAVANAAITVLGSASGMKPTQTGASKPGTDAEEQDMSEVEQLAGRSARATELQRLRVSTGRTMQVELRGMLAALGSTPKGDRRAALLDQVEGMLNGYKDIVTSLRNGGNRPVAPEPKAVEAASQ
ncbi:MAG TPA: hypothetical protein VJQ44_19390 [Gemmatimonadales bacterium]|nr:hypothetical protein [Gemmatimonadales bacterium]